jgi:DNA-binding SARP family transcriptional activator
VVATLETPAGTGESQPEDRPAPLRLYLLGRFEVVLGDAPIPAHAWRRRRPADLLQLVALAPGRTISREEAIGALWPDKDAASGANNLHRALYDLRQILGGRHVDIERGQLSLDPAVWFDVDAFEQAAADPAPARRAEALALYRGDLLGDGAQPWLAARRLELRRRFAEAAAPLARAAAEAGDAATAVPLLRRIVDVDPVREEAHRDLIRLLASTGRRAEALRAYDTCEAALRGAGRGPPDEETRTLRQSIQLGAFGPAQDRHALDGVRQASRRLLGAVDPPPVRGRNALLLLLESLVERGAGTMVLLGERGVGKTRLAIEGARFAQGRGGRVLSATATATPGAPYGLFLDLFRHERESGHDPLAAPGLSSDAGRHAIHQAVAQALLAIAEGRPIFLLLDDLHAADESSLNLLHDLALRAGELRLMIVATCRDDEVHAGRPIQTALSHLDVGGLARGVRIPRLTLAGTREQLGDLLGAPPDEPLLGQVYRATDGSPFLVEEAARAHQESRQVPADPAISLRARVTRLGPRAEGLLAAAAVVGRRFEFELVQAVCGLSAHDALKTLEECLAARLVDEDGTGYLFRHDLVREALYEALPPGRRTALHAATADALEAGRAGLDRPELLARHRRQAGQLDRALRHLAAAGHRAAAQACLAEALAFHAEALELAPRASAPAAVRRELLDASGRVQLALGELSGAARSFAQAARLAAADGPAEAGPRARLHRLGAVALAAEGDLGGAFETIAAGLALAGAEADEERAALLHLSAQLQFHEGRSAETVAAAEACAEAARRAGDADLLARSGDMVAIARGLAGEPLAPVGDAIASADRLAQDVAPEHPIDLHLALWDRDLLGDRTCAELGRAAAILSERARQRLAPEAVATGRYGEGVVALAAGQLDAAEALLRDAREGFRAVGSGMGEALAIERLASLCAQLGRFEEAGKLLGQGVVLAERGMLRRHVLTRLHVAETRTRIAAGLPSQADAALREASESAARHGECLTCDALLRPEAARVAIAFGRLDDAEAEARALEEVARQRGGRGLQAIARLTRARVQAARGKSEDALVSLAQARAGFLASGLRYEAARTARLEARLRGSLPEAWSSLDALVRVDPDA